MDTNILAMTEIGSFKSWFMGKVIVLKAKDPDTDIKVEKNIVSFSSEEPWSSKFLGKVMLFIVCEYKLR